MFSVKNFLYKYLFAVVISIIVVFSLYPFNTNADKINHEIPKGYYQNKQLGYVFHWLRDRSITSSLVRLRKFSKAGRINSNCCRVILLG